MVATSASDAGNHDELKGGRLLRQVLIGVTVASFSGCQGAHTTVPAVLLPQLMTNGSDIPLTMQQGTWFASMHSLSALAGSALAGVLVHHLGPRRVLQLQALPCIAGWLLMALAYNFPMLMVARCLIGSSCGVAMSAVQVYLGESSSPHIRGRMVCISGLMISLGLLVSYVSGFLLPWRWVPVAPVIVFIMPNAIGLFFVPESPYWLLGRNRREHARQSLRVLRGDDDVAERELQLITAASKARQKPLTMRELGREMRKLSVLAPFLTITALFVLRIMTGVATVMTYAVVIFQGTGSALGSYESAILIGCVRAFDSVCCVLYVSDRFGRRPLLMFSGIGCSLAALGMAAFIFARDQAPLWPGWQRISWLPLPLILMFTVAFDYGFARTGWVVHSEILPNRIRSALSGVTLLIHNLSTFVSVFSFPYIRETLTLAGSFCIFAFFSLLGLLLTIFFIPETKNKRLEAIEAFYVKRFGGHQAESSDVTEFEVVQRQSE
ncbi:facilitated trehalose transporter Tret1-2 homolog [Pollicipes pollicipes]|uniref:facilitated trehalose transporter Tret1-2 homolog n=1 Tax=Pollicipes pollicipes TaxID=41117 RepID=UPI001885623F|nr:facilitated trehalose transporter Tret1-2 homolog [Pollicipes pollicipes]